MNLADAYHAFYMAVLVCLSVLTLFCLFRAIQGPRIADRIVSINMICTLTMTMICILAAMLGEGYLVDVGAHLRAAGFPRGGGAVQGLHGRRPGGARKEGKGGPLRCLTGSVSC